MISNQLEVNKSKFCQTGHNIRYFQHICLHHWVKRNYDNNQRFLRSQHCLAVTTDHRPEIRDQETDTMNQISCIRDHKSGISDAGSQQNKGEAKGPPPG